MAARYQKKSDDALLLALACGATVEGAARQCRLSERTVYRRLADPAFQRRLKAVRSEMVGRTAGMLSAASGESVKTLVGLQKETVGEAVRLGAAKAVLEIGVKMRLAADLEGRVAALEQKLAANGSA